VSRTALTITSVSHVGASLVPVACDQDNGNSFFNDGNTVLAMTNLTGAPITVTVHAQAYVDGNSSSGLKVPDRSYTIQPTATTLAGPFAQATYNDASGNVEVDMNGAILLLPCSFGFTS
jgi:hypothetical protein